MKVWEGKKVWEGSVMKPSSGVNFHVTCLATYQSAILLSGEEIVVWIEFDF